MNPLTPKCEIVINIALKATIQVDIKVLKPKIVE